MFMKNKKSPVTKVQHLLIATALVSVSFYGFVQAITWPSTPPGEVEGGKIGNWVNTVKTLLLPGTTTPTNLGIGAGVDASEKLEVDGNVKATGFIGDGSQLTGINYTETDPQVGTLTNSKWCTSDGSVVSCVMDAPAGSPWSDVTGGINYASGNVGIGATTPSEKLEINGAVKIGTTASACNASKAGTIRYEAGAFEGCDGSAWVALNSFACGTTLTDARDSQTYATVQIGTQCWMGEDLRVGEDADMATTNPNTATDNGIIEKNCLNDTVTNCNATNGSWYTWDEAMWYSTTEGAQGICPAGWHIPTDNEWKTMEMQLGMTQAQADATGWRGTDQGTQLKAGGSSGMEWNISGFNFPPWYAAEEWIHTSTQADASNSVYRVLRDAGVYRSASSIKGIAASVRCLKD